MKKPIYLLLFGSFALSAQAQDAQVKSRIDSVSYLAGQNIAQSVLKDFPEANVSLLLQGISDAMMQRPGLILDPTNQCVMSYFQEKMQATQQAEQAMNEELMAIQNEAGRVNREKGEAFLIENAKRKEIQVTASGLQYEVLQEGTGAKPKDTNTVKVHYEGFLLNGMRFDSSKDRGQPAEFPLNQVIRGWTEGVQLMSVGSKYKFYIPYQLGYGEMGSGETIPGGSVLIFDVELIEIVK